MKRESHEIKALVSEYEQKMSEASIPLWMDAPDLLDVLDYYEQNNQNFEAELCMRLALRLHPDDPEVLIRRAYRFKNEGRWAEADEVVAAMSDRESLDVQFYYAERALSRMLFDEADAIYERVLQRETDLDRRLLEEEGEPPMGINDLLIEIGELFLDYGGASYAKKYLARVPADVPEHARATLLMGEVAVQAGHYDEARNAAESILDGDPYNMEAWLFVADAANEQKDFEKCAEAADFALAIDPQNEKALRFKAIGELGLEHWDEVLRVYDVYDKLYPNDYGVALSAGEILLNRREYARAREVLSRAAQNCPTDLPDRLRIVNDIAIVHAAQGDLDKAYELLDATNGQGAGAEELLLRTVEMSIMYELLDFAAGVFRRYINVVGYSAEACRRVAHLLCERGRFDVPPAALTIWESLFAAPSDMLDTVSPYLAYAARQLHRGSLYLRWLETALRVQPVAAWQIFMQVYPGTPFDLLMRRAREEFPQD